MKTKRLIFMVVILAIVTFSAESSLSSGMYIYETTDGRIKATDYELTPDQLQKEGLRLLDSSNTTRKPPPADPGVGTNIEQESERVREREHFRQLLWEQDQRFREDAERIRNIQDRRIQQEQEHELRLLREQAEARRKTMEEQRKAEYDDAWRRKYMGLDVPSGQTQPTVIVVPAEIMWSVQHTEGRSQWWVEVTNPFSQSQTLTFSCRGTTMKGKSYSGTGSVSVGPRSTVKTVDLPGMPHLYWSTANCSRTR